MTRMELEGKVAVVTGGSSGIGKAVGVMLAKRGARVALVARREDVLAKAVSELGARGSVSGHACDVSDESSVSAMAQGVTDALGPVDILINNAGFAIYGSVESLSSTQIRAHMETNYFGAVHCTKAFLPQMLTRRSGKIVNVASVAASFGLPGIAAYCASKFAMLGFSEALRGELCGTGVGVTVVSPIAVRTPFFDHESFANIPRYSPMSLSAEKVAGAVIRAIDSRRGEIMVPGAARIAVWAKHTIPQLVEYFVSSAFRKALRRTS